jgi:4-amino-4-deoxy-L-arabinose transferase-like glycosyltransferase
VAVFLLATADLARESRLAGLHVDEPRMLNRGFMAGRLYREYVTTGVASDEWLSEVWQPRKPPLGNVIVAAGLWLDGAIPPAAPYQYDWLHDERWNAEHGQVPAPEVLRAGRRLVPFFGGAAVAAIFFLAADAAGIPAGLVAAALFHWNPVVRTYGTRALADVPMMAFALWALWHLANRVATGWTRAPGVLLVRAAMLGVLVGLASAIKQNGALMVCVAAATFAAWVVVRRGTGLGRAALALAAVLATSYGLYVAVNPVLYSAPITLSLAQVQAWNLKFMGHAKVRPESALPGLATRANAVVRVVAGNRFATLPFPWLTGILVLGGLVALVVRARQAGAWSVPAVLLVWAGVSVAVVTCWIPLDWDRYYLPVIAVTSVLAGAALAPLTPQASRAQRKPT